ncbi:C17orf53-like protein [Spatholobus suberectus]|nr:C17orf53-like protein [Spatholobus suberectus]
MRTQPNRRKGNEPTSSRASIRLIHELCVVMELEPWEALDVDDSAFLRPCNSSLIPGPAGAVQAVMRNRRRDDPLPTQEFIRRVGRESDRDFNTNPWLCALQFVRSQGMVDGDDVAHGTPLSSIKSADRLALAVAVVKSCTSNGFGDMTVTLKDPTGTVSASVHRKVFAQGEFGKDITVGSVLVLQKVAVFSPTRSTCYLNITLHNILKVFSKDSAPPWQQLMYPARPVISTTPSLERHDNLWMRGSTFSLPQERTEGIISSLRSVSSFRQVADSDKQRGELLASTSGHNNNGNVQNRETVLERENLSESLDDAGPVEVNCGGELESEKENQPNPPKLDEGRDSLAWIAQGNSSTTNLVHTSQSHGANHLERQKQMVNQKSSIPHWTEEQLDELLAFD